MLERIAQLAIPPAWKDVWICPFPNGHIQATGTDAAGRRQYRYHDEWRRKRDLEKFERMVHFGRALPHLRRRVAENLALEGYPREKVLAAAVRLLDIGYFRIGGEEYAEEHETFGLATMERQHVRVSGDVMRFDYPAKGGLRRRITVTDRDVAPVLVGLKRRRGGGSDLLCWKEAGRWHDATADDVNAYLKETIGDGFSAKDFRTWSATVLAALGVAEGDPDASRNAGKRLVSAVCKAVSTELGNTPAVCRSSYIDPRVFDRHQAGETVTSALRRASRGKEDDLKVRQRVEAAVIALLSEEAEVIAPQRRGGSSRPRAAAAASSSRSASSVARSKEESSPSPRKRTSPSSKAA